MPHILSFCVSHPYKPIIFIFPPKPWAVCADWQATQSSTPGHINIHWSWLDLPGAIKQMALREKIPTFPRISLFKRWSINMWMWIYCVFPSLSVLLVLFVCLFVLRVLFYLTPRKKKGSHNPVISVFSSWAPTVTDIRIWDTVNRHYHDQSHGF